MNVLLTGAAGFLGWHTRLRLHAQQEHTVIPLTRDNWSQLPRLVQTADAVIHLAGVNRADDTESVHSGNVALAETLASAISERPGLRIVYANSTQCANGTPYGTGKAKALDVLSTAVRKVGGHLVDVRLPNLFGEHGRPWYNSFVATFVDAATRAETPVLQDNDVPLLHAQDAAQELVTGLTTSRPQLDPSPALRGVSDVWELLNDFATTYRRGNFPDLSTKFHIDLFNTYRSALFPGAYPIPLTPHTDHRGTFIETVRSLGGEGQSSISTTAPGVTRGEHFHLRKIERFVVVEGTATIKLRRMFHDNIVKFHVTGDQPGAIDMPTGWTHSITNTGRASLVTQFWTHDLYRPEAPDTYPANVTLKTQPEATV